LREFILKQGPSKNTLNLEWGALWALNKKYIDPKAPHHTSIIQDQAVYCQVHCIEGPEVVSKPTYVKNLSLGSKRVMYHKTILLDQTDAHTFEQDEEITLMNWGNAYVRNITKDPTSKFITSLDLKLHLDGDVKKTNNITWLAATASNLIPVDLITFDHLITKDKLEKEDRIEDFLTLVTEFRSQAFADCNVVELPQGTVVQFERKGYYKLDAPFKDGTKVTFFSIPTGKS
jgi:glutamyl-tRNA synthetase